jgi:Divergent InlB B-repeat domain
MRIRAVSALLFGLALATAQAATFTVTITNDSGPGSLRQAILDANATPGDDTIVFATNGTIVLSSPLPTVTDNTVIVGPGTNQLIISGNNAVQVFSLNAGTTNTISGLTVANGLATGYASGAGITNAGALTLLNCALVNNTNLGGWGGAVFSSGNLAVFVSAFSGNQVVGENGSGSSHTGSGGGGAAGLGGAIFSLAGSVVVNGCSFISNSATGGNGGDAPQDSGSSCGGGPQRGCACTSGGYGSGGGGAVANTCDGGKGGFGAGGGGALGQAHPSGAGGFGGGGGGMYSNDYDAGGGGAGLGGGIFVDTGTITIVDCDFAGNQVTGGTGGWGGDKYTIPAINAARAGANGAGIGPDLFTRAATVLPVLTATTVGGGTVTVDPPSSPYLSNSWATLTATPASGWRFLYWLGDASGTSPMTTLKATRNKYAQAVFSTPLTVSALMSISPQSDFYPYGTAVKLTALPPAGTYFSSWTGDVSGTNNPLSLAVTNPNQSVSFQLGALPAGGVALTILESGRGHVAASPLANLYTNGQQVTITAAPDPGQDFIGWTGDASGTQNPLPLAMSQSKVITANFTERPTLRVGTPLEGPVEDGFRLTLTGEFGTAYEIWGSTNLLGWTAVGTVTNTYGTVQLTDPAGTDLPCRFYRAVTN